MWLQEVHDAKEKMEEKKEADASSTKGILDGRQKHRELIGSMSAAKKTTKTVAVRE